MTYPDPLTADQLVEIAKKFAETPDMEESIKDDYASPLITVRSEPRPPSHPSVEHVIFAGDRMTAKVFTWVDVDCLSRADWAEMRNSERFG